MRLRMFERIHATGLARLLEPRSHNGAAVTHLRLCPVVRVSNSGKHVAKL